MKRMKKTTFLTIGMISCLSFFSVQDMQAQLWKKIKSKVEKKVEDKADEILNGKNTSYGATTSESNDKGGVPYIEEVFSFIPGKKVAFEDNFEGERQGLMPSNWKSSGNGSVVTIDGLEGNWLKMEPNSTYKLDSLMVLPQNFTIEFDLVTRSDVASDMGEMSFGFARDNSVRRSITDGVNNGSVTSTRLHFWNQDITHSSSDTDKYNTLDFPLAKYSNAVIHVSIAVEGEQMRVYLDKSKLLDTQMFLKNTPKYFYITAPYDYKKGAKAFFGNFRISENK